MPGDPLPKTPDASPHPPPAPAAPSCSPTSSTPRLSRRKATRRAIYFCNFALGQGPARKPAVWGVFQLLGIVPLMYWALLFPDGRGQKVWAWPFALGMMAFGAFSLLPYLILRRPYPNAVPGARNLAVRWFAGRPFAVFAAVALVSLLVWITAVRQLGELCVLVPRE